ncbi:DUF1707 SHOCT-like domain-containing protein [Hugenholtzia roseola]|uniref:DUF1707 SHOCT-like domain-containing protein n=1 Tax=Hugenholtzia roseola TaxID=1002 RepID=UPI00041736C4|nr:LiaF domain-containing protein [Hugenholtzia roseola]
MKKTTYGVPKKREAVIEALQNAFSNQNLDEEEYINRLDEAMKATSIEELELVLFDFPTEVKAAIFQASTPQEGQNALAGNEWADVSSMKPYQSQMPDYQNVMPKDVKDILSSNRHQIELLDGKGLQVSNFFSSQKIDLRRAQMVGNRLRLEVECVMGETVVDLRSEALQGKTIDLHIGGAMGEVKILLPRGGEIVKQMQLYLGDFKVKDKRKGWLARLTGTQSQEINTLNFKIILHGSFWLGEVSVVY